MADNAQKFIGRNRAPRVQIEYDVELYGAEKKVQLPFVMGVMSDLLGKSTEPQPAIADHKFLEIDVDSFDKRMKSMAPRAAFTVPNTLTGEGNIAIDLTFESMRDFTPGAIAAKVDSLRPLLEARTQLQTLMAYMDGKSGAEDLIEKILQTPALLSTLAQGDAASDADQSSALESLRGVALPDEENDQSEEVLAALAAEAPPEGAQETDLDDALAALAVSAPEMSTAADGSEAEAALAALAAAAPQAIDAPESAEDALAALRDLPSPDVDDAADDSADVLGDLSRAGQDVQPSAAPSSDGILEGLAATEIPQDEASDPSAQIADILSDLEDSQPAPDADEADLADILGSLDQDASADPVEDAVDVQDLLAEIAAPDAPDESAGLDDVLAGLEAEVPTEPANDLDDVLADLAADAVEAEDSEALNLDELLSGLEAESDSAEDTDGADIDSILSELDALPREDDAAESGSESEASLTELLGEADTDLDLDDLLGDLTAEEEGAGGDIGDSDALDDLLAGLESDADPTADTELSTDFSDLDALLGDLDSSPRPDEDAPSAESESADPAPQAEFGDPEFAYGTITADRPAPQQLTRKRFRIALFGDFSGRSARGQVETGEGLAQRPGILLDPDTVEEVIEGFASDLILPLGKDGGGISVKLREFDDLHPDELFDNVSLFSELVSLREQLHSGVTVDHASRSLAAWAAQYGTPVRAPKRSSASTSVPADRRLSAFQQLVGDTKNSLRTASPIEDLLARVVGPHIRALPTPEVPAMQAAVDAALSDAMRLVLHHPEFQALEAQWRSLDLIARSVEVDDNLEVVLYDVSAEELAADLAAQDDLTTSGFTRLLSEEPMDPDLGRGAYSALIGLYGFEETPPHAELLGRIARVAAHVDAPFFTSLSPEFLKTVKKDRPALVAQAWDTLQQMPEAGHLALASPRFLLRRPYGAKSNPVDAFDFEEFSEEEGLRGMLWGNPVVLVAILLARSFKENGASMQLGSIMSLGGMPYHTVNDRFGDQVALPCTERNIDLDKIAMANERGVMALSAVKGRDELRLTSFSSLAGAEVLGPWSGLPAPAPSPADPRDKTGGAGLKPTEQAAQAPEGDDPDLDDLGLGDLGLDDLDLDDLGLGDLDLDDEASPEAEVGLDDLDALLAGFEEGAEGAEEEEDGMDAELAALLADL